MKKVLFFIGMLLTMTGMATAQSAYKLGSPNGDIQVTVTVSDQIRYDIACQQEPLLQQGLLQLELGKEVLGQRPKVTKSSTTTIDETIRPVVPLRFSTIATTATTGCCCIFAVAMPLSSVLSMTAWPTVSSPSAKERWM